MSFEPRDFVRHILVETTYLLRASDGMAADTFLADETLRRAFVRSLEIIGGKCSEGCEQEGRK